MEKKEKYIGYLKYSGESLIDGLLDTRKSAEALLGFDEVLRYFLIKEEPELMSIDFEIPVKISKGSWEILIPEMIDKLMSPDGLIVATVSTYFISSATIAAKEGIANTGLAKDIKSIFKNSLIAVQWVIKIALHVKSMKKKKFDGAKIKQIDLEEMIEIPNEKNDYLCVPKKYLDLYCGCPEKLFSKNTRLIHNNRNLEFGVFDNEREESVSISVLEKPIFFSINDEEDVLLPELEHGEFVEIEGEITKGNERANSLGLEYKGHILTCKPFKGNISNYKTKLISQSNEHIFPTVIISGYIDRSTENDQELSKKPRILFINIEQKKNTQDSESLFNVINKETRQC